MATKNAKGDGLKTGITTGMRVWDYCGWLLGQQKPNGKFTRSDAELAELLNREFPQRKGHFQPLTTARAYFNQCVESKGERRAELVAHRDGKAYPHKVAKHGDEAAELLPPGRGEAAGMVCGFGKGKHGRYAKAGGEKAAKVNLGWESAFATKAKGKAKAKASKKTPKAKAKAKAAK